MQLFHEVFGSIHIVSTVWKPQNALPDMPHRMAALFFCRAHYPYNALRRYLQDFVDNERYNLSFTVSSGVRAEYCQNIELEPGLNCSCICVSECISFPIFKAG
jgi:hypothetical protein